MTDPIAVLSAAAAAVTLFDSIADQVERFIKKRPEPAVPPEYRMTIGEADGDLVATEHGREIQRITGEDLANRNLPQPILDHVLVLEKSMQNHYTVWSKLYPQLAVLDSPVQKAKVEAQLSDVITSMKSDLHGILAFLESAGLHLDDHYLHIRQVVQEY
ncbi:MAG TPA: hypothetical protein VHJ82_09780 [Actinomycetota bacterium]|nr:hypothetical protein [Actinomycetota bacterium]